MKKTKIVFLLALVFPLSTLASIIHVPGDQPTIQAGIDAASDGDTVLVADGTYTGDGNRDLDFNGKAITVRSQNGPENCVIYCEGSTSSKHRGFHFHNEERADSVVEGFTIQNGYVTYSFGGAIFCEEASPTIKNNIIFSNYAWGYYIGGAIGCLNAYPKIIGNVITANHALYGGGIACSGGSPLIQNNTITGNWAYASGGGIFYSDNASSVIVHNTIQDNFLYEDADEMGGGIGCWNATGVIEHNLITGNTTDANSVGGGIACNAASPTIRKNIITWNESGSGGGILCEADASPLIDNNLIAWNEALWGGGITCSTGAQPIVTSNIIKQNTVNNYGGGIDIAYGAAPTITNNFIAWNTANAGGGGICCYNSCTPTIFGSTIYGNSAVKGGGIYTRFNASPVVSDTIINMNVAPIGKEIYAGDEYHSSVLTISYSDVIQSLVYVEPGSTVNWGDGMIEGDPLFVSGPWSGMHYLSQIEAGQTEDSPCLNAGSTEVGFYPESSGYHAVYGTTRTDSITDTGIIDIGYHYILTGIADACGPYQGTLGVPVMFDASGSFHNSGDVMSGYRWDWTDDGTWDTGWLSEPVVSRIYPEVFQGSVRLEVKNADGDTDTVLTDVTIFPVSVNTGWLEEALEPHGGCFTKAE